MTSHVVGSAGAFIGACLVIVGWGVLGPIFKFSDTWQLVINTGTTIVTFLIVFLIQNSQNRDALALHLKLDELLRATEGARNSMVNLEALSDEELLTLHKEFEALQKKFGLEDVPVGPEHIHEALEARGKRFTLQSARHRAAPLWRGDAPTCA